VATFVMTFSMTFFGFLIGYLWGWQLALVITCSLPVMSIATALFAISLQNEQTAT
jgi:ATP-binding cassette subfamily B (MDR/TAP) protein 1